MGGAQNGKILLRYFGDVTEVTSNMVFKARFCHNQFEKPQFSKSCNFRSPISKVKGPWGVGPPPPEFGDF